MVKLNESQEQLISRLGTQKEYYDDALIRLDIEYAQAKDELKNPIRKTVQEALESGVPQRQIYQRGLGYAQVNSMLAFLEPRAESPSERLRRISDPVAPGLGKSTDGLKPLSVQERGNGMWAVIDRDGDEWLFGFATTGGQYFLFEGNENLAIAGPEVRQALLDHKPGRVDLREEESA